MLQCYNRGCGQTYDPEKNTDESCLHHPGMPFFHDAYKGWSCCNRKTVDFTEFLNMKGCSLSKHSNLKPPEPEKPPKDEVEEEIVMPKPIAVALVRPSFENPLTMVCPTVLPALKEAVDSIALEPEEKKEFNDSNIEIGAICKNGGCKCTYTSPEANESECRYHPGVPIFHEGMKYWSCCQKKTSDFAAFMDQKGCSYGRHKWKDEADRKTVNCRFDWHQTATDVIVAIYAKLYHYEKSTIEVNPIRLKVNLVFANHHDATFNIDLELRGIINVDQVTAKMFSTKIEITMPKAEPGTWSNLDFPKKKVEDEMQKAAMLKPRKENEFDDSDSDVDLDDIETLH